MENEGIRDLLLKELSERLGRIENLIGFFHVKEEFEKTRLHLIEVMERIKAIEELSLPSVDSFRNRLERIEYLVDGLNVRDELSKLYDGLLGHMKRIEALEKKVK